MSITTNLARLVAVCTLLWACVPQHLQKYQKEKEQKDAREGRGDPLAPSSDPTLPPPSPEPARARTVAASSKGEPAAPRATIYAVDKQTYRFALREAEVWDAALNVLLRNYNLTIVDRQSGILSTEWDSFYLSNAVYRNKVSLRVARSNYNAVDVTVRNNVEKLRDASQATSTVGAVWLPAEDPANEVARIVQNMALVLGQPPPVLPPNAGVARDVKGAGSSEQTR